MLTIRMILYFLSALVAGQGLAIYDHDAGTITFAIEDLAMAIGGIATFGGTFLVGRVAKARGGAT